MNYRELLKRYMHHVMVIDGTAFIDSVNHEFDFRPNEREMLEKIHKEIPEEYNS